VGPSLRCTECATPRPRHTPNSDEISYHRRLGRTMVSPTFMAHRLAQATADLVWRVHNFGLGVRYGPVTFSTRASAHVQQSIAPCLRGTCYGSYRDFVRVVQAVKSIGACSFVIEGYGKHEGCVRYVPVGSLWDPGVTFLSLRICSTRDSPALRSFLTALHVVQLPKRSMRAGSGITLGSHSWWHHVHAVR